MATPSNRNRSRGFRPIKGQGSVQAGIYWSQQVTSMSLGLVVPVLIGWWIDTTYKTQPAAIVVGSLIGFALLMWRLLQMISPDIPTDPPNASATADADNSVASAELPDSPDEPPAV